MMCAEWISNAAQHAVYAMIYAYERSIVIMRVAKIPAEIVEAKVLESLRSRMDPVSRRVYPRWKLMMRSSFKKAFQKGLSRGDRPRETLVDLCILAFDDGKG